MGDFVICEKDHCTPISILPISLLWEVLGPLKEKLTCVPGQVGLVGNEIADEEAKREVVNFIIAEQNKVCCTLSNLEKVRLPYPKLKTSTPRPFQTVYSRY